MDNKNFINSLVIVASILSVGLIISIALASNAYVKVNGNSEIAVTGQAKDKVVADLATWIINIDAQEYDKASAYNKVVSDKESILKFLKETKGGIEKNEILDDSEIVVSQINSYATYEKDNYYNSTGNILFHSVSQSITVTSSKVYLIDELSRTITDTLGSDINISSYAPSFTCLDLSDKKVEMVGLATADSVERAKQIVDNTNKRLGAITSAKTGVFQIVPVGSNQVDDYGINDTSSIEKEIVCTVKTTFKIN